MTGYTAHPTAEIGDGATVGDGTHIWQNCIILDGARIGSGCKLAHNVFVENGVVVGDRVVIKDNVCLYDGVVIADEAFIGPNAVFTNVRTPRAFIARKNEFETTEVGRGATIGANATLVCGHSIGDYATIGAGAVVTSDVAPYSLMAGNPARRIGWVSRAGERLGPDLCCPSTGEKYVETENALRPATESSVPGASGGTTG
ncbi:MAG TPA: N-acetyltransferase [Rhizobiales bacterium]|nr:N-acetyltransferase [Hyphomicrobiales bacterium]